MLSAFIYWGLLLGPTPKLLVASSSQFRPTSDYQAVVTQHLNKLRNSTKMTFDSASIVIALEKTFPEVDSATVELPFIGRQPVVRLGMFGPALNLEAAGKSYIISTEGVVVGEAGQLLPIKNLPRVIDKSGSNISPGQQFLSPQQVNFIKVLVAQSKYAKVTIGSFVLPSSAQEIDMKLAGVNYFVKFFTGGDPVEQAGSLFATLRHIKAKHITPSLYIDVRVTGKVFYR